MAISDRDIEAVARLLSALGEPSRLKIVRALWEAPASVGAIVRVTGLKQANVSKQLALLAAAGVLDRRREGTSVIYFIAVPLIRDMCELVCEGARQVTAQRAGTLEIAV